LLTHELAEVRRPHRLLDRLARGEQVAVPNKLPDVLLGVLGPAELLDRQIKALPPHRRSLALVVLRLPGDAGAENQDGPPSDVGHE
jgi:hypothetical protein